MLEYKREESTGNHFLLEVNGRFWGSLQLAVDAGVDFPHLIWELASGRRPDVPRSYRVGVKNRWLLGDLDHLLIRLSDPHRDLRPTDAAPSRWRALIDFVKCTKRGVGDQVVSSADPRPFLYELRRYASAVAASVVHRLRIRLTRARVRGLRFARPSIPT